jgi:hypothetical protein
LEYAPTVLFFLGVQRDHRLAGVQKRADLGVQVAELGVAVRVLGPLELLGVGLQAVTVVLQQSRSKCWVAY